LVKLVKDLREFIVLLNSNVEYLVVGASVIGREDLLANKLTSGRPQDLADAATLENG